MTLIIFLFILSVLIVVHEFGHFIAAKIQGVKVEKFSLGFGLRILSRKIKDTEYTLSAIPLGGYVKMAGDNLEEYQGKPNEYFSKTPGQRSAIVLCGPILNYVLGFLCFWLIFFLGYPMATTKVGGLVDGFGAKAAGVQVGDKIISVDGQKVDYWEDLQKLVQSKKANTQVNLYVRRDNQQYAIDVLLKEEQLDDPLGQKRSVGLLGIKPASEFVKVRHGFGESFILAANKTWELTVMTYKATWRMIRGKLSLRESVTGPLGIFYITSEAAHLGIIALMHLVAILSISLCIFNLLPFPVLDGGHIFLLAVEKIRGKSIGVKTERIITQIGMTAIISLAVIVTYNDLLRFFGDKISAFFIR